MTARTCLLLPAAGDELRQAVRVADGAVQTHDSDQSASVLFVQGLAEYRQGNFAQAISTMRNDAVRIFGPAPRLVVALALHRSGQMEEARKTLSAAILGHDWRAIQVRNPNDWLLHTLRREAEQLILPNLQTFLAGKYQAMDNTERLALLGVCQFENRPQAQARLYAAAFAADPELVNRVGDDHRYAAARAAAQVGNGQCEDSENLSEEERDRWRKQAHDWLAYELIARSNMLDSGLAARRAVWDALTFWRHDPALSGLREPGMLERLSTAERDQWLAFWKKVDTLLNRATGP